jgi:ribosomal protein S8
MQMFKELLELHVKLNLNEQLYKEGFISEWMYKEVRKRFSIEIEEEKCFLNINYSYLN